MKASKLLVISGIMMMVYALVFVVLSFNSLVAIVAPWGDIASFFQYMGFWRALGIFCTSLLPYLLYLVVGLLGIIFRASPGKAMLCLILGIVASAGILALLVYTLLTVSGAYLPTILLLAVGIVLPVPYCMGALRLKKLG